MGSGVSIPERVDEEAAKEFAGIHFDKNLFNSLKEGDGTISREQFNHLISAHYNRIDNKFCGVGELFSKDIWNPLLMSSYYDIFFNSRNGLYHMYDSATEPDRRSMLLDSCKQSDIDLELLYCQKSCQSSFVCGTRCIGKVRLTNIAEAKEEDLNKRDNDNFVWTNYATTDPDVIAIHLWTYSMGGTRQEQVSSLSEFDENKNDSASSSSKDLAFYKRLNLAVMQDDPHALRQMAYIICGIVRWIRKQQYTPTTDVVLYRGTPIEKNQEHEVGHALAPRSDSVSKDAHESSGKLCRMPLFVASSSSIEKAQQFTKIRADGIACPILEFVLRKDHTCDSVACVENLSHFPDEKEWLMSAYVPLEYSSQRLEYLEVGFASTLKLVMVVQYNVLSHKKTFEEYEEKGQDIKTVMLLCKQSAFESGAVAERIIHHIADIHEEREKTRKDVLEQKAELWPEMERLSLLEEECDALALKKKVFTEYEAREIIEYIQLNSDSEAKTKKTRAMELLSKAESEVATLRQLRAEAKEKMHKISLEHISAQEAVQDASDSFGREDRKVRHLETEISALSTRLQQFHQRKLQTEETLENTHQTIRLTEENIRSEQESYEKACQELKTYESSMEPFLREERAAFQRWEAREKEREAREGPGGLSWEERLQRVARAREEFMRAAFPPGERVALQTRRRALLGALEGLRGELEEQTRAVEVLEGRERALSARVQRCEEERVGLREALRQQFACRTEAAEGLRRVEAAEQELVGRRSALEEELQRSLVEEKRVWDRLGHEVTAIADEPPSIETF